MRSISIRSVGAVTIRRAGLTSCRPDSRGHLSAISAASKRGALSLPAWQKRWRAVQAGRSLLGLTAWAAWLTSGWAADHAHGLPGATPILALDMYEHAYHLDFGAKAAAYVDQIMANLNWERIDARYRLAIGDEAAEAKLFLPFGAPVQEEARISAEELKAALEDNNDHRPVLLDLCLPKDLPRRTDMLAGASMHAPAAL